MGGSCAFTQHWETAMFPREHPGVPGNLSNWEKRTHEFTNLSLALIVSSVLLTGTGFALSSWVGVGLGGWGGRTGFSEQGRG